MKRKDREALRSMKPEGLGAQEKTVRAKLTDLAMQAGSGKTKNTRETKSLRKKLAVILTVMKEHEYAKENK